MPVISLSAVSQFLCRDATSSEGATLATRVLVEALTPGLRHFNSVFKDALRLARNSRPPEVEAQLNAAPEFHELLGTVCKDLQAAITQDWWRSIIDVAECGAQREVLTRLIYKQIAVTSEAHDLRISWQETYLQSGGAQRFLNQLIKRQPASEQVAIQEIAKVALAEVTIPSTDPTRQVEWLVAQRKFIEASFSQAWGEAREHLRDLVKIAPRAPAVSLYWSLIRCAEGQVLEALNGVKRAIEVDPSNQRLKQIEEEVPLWKEAIVSEQQAREQRSLGQDNLPLPETRFGQPTGYADQVQRHTLDDGSPKEKADQSADWSLPTGLIQAIADLGAERTLDVSVAGVFSQLYHQLQSQRALVRDALTKYPEASGLNILTRQLNQSVRLVERGLGVYKVDPKGDLPPITLGIGQTGMSSLSAGQLAELKQAAAFPLLEKNSLGDDELPPPLPDRKGDEMAPTALVDAVNQRISVSITPPPDVLTIDSQAPLDFTLEPESTDLARAEGLMRRGEFSQAEHCLLNLLDLNPFDPYVHNDLGVLYFQIQRFGDAKAHFMLAIECEPNYEEAWSNLVELFASLGHLHHVLPFFKRFQTLVETSPSLKRLKKLCNQFAPEGVEELPPPRYADTVGLKLPLSGSFFLAPSDEEEVLDAISAPLPIEWDPEERARVDEERSRAQEERAVQRRVEVSALLDEYTRSTVPKVEEKKTLIGWVKEKVGWGDSPELETLPSVKLSPEEELEQIYDPELPPPPRPKPLPEDLHRVRNIAFSMLCVPAGSFKMGTHINSPYGCANEQPQHIAVMSKPFQLGRVPVTQELYQAVMFRNPSHIKAPGHPVVRVSWFDAIRFCNTLSELEGLAAVYQIAGGPRPEVSINHNAAGYRLPTEAEWEYCARGREPYRYAGSESIHGVGWAQVDKIQTVARKEANGWGFFDMSGNVWEWCNDGLREYQAQSQLDPRGEMHPYMHTPSARVIRGGSWCFEEDGARVAFRGRGAPGLRITSLGFRIARSL